jgi:hypothetical protein
MEKKIHSPWLSKKPAKCGHFEHFWIRAKLALRFGIVVALVEKYQEH